MKIIRYVCVRGTLAIHLARNVVTAGPDSSLFAIEGWHMYVDRKTSFFVFPGIIYSPYVSDPCFFYVPFPRNLPVERNSARRDLTDFERYMLLQDTQCFPDPVAGNASAYREETRDESMHFFSIPPILLCTAQCFLFHTVC